MPPVSENTAPEMENFEKFIANLAERTKQTRPYSHDFKVVRNLDAHLENLEKAYDYFSKITSEKKITSRGVEWFLDNYYVIKKTVVLIKQDLPIEYFQKLPSLEVEKHLPRIYYFARQMLAYYQIEILNNDLYSFINTYQKTLTLKMSELWALPVMLRLTLIEIISGNIYELIENMDYPQQVDFIKLNQIGTDEVIARSIRTLLMFDRIDWKEVFEANAKVEKFLSKDPLGIYHKMDFDTRDLYRKKIEVFAENSPFSEVEVTQMAVSLAQEDNHTVKKKTHIGYYLIDQGEKELKTKIKYKHPINERIRKVFFDNNTLIYIGAITIITIMVVMGLFFLASHFSNNPWHVLIIAILSIVPATSVAVHLLNSILTSMLPPHLLPKMNFSKKVPKQFRTMVAIPALLTSDEEIGFLLKQLELHYLANHDRNIGFVLLSDFADAEQENMPEDNALLEKTISGIDTLNERYRGDNGRRPFYLFHRRRQWNPAEEIWMGWERKRGKLADFNRYLLERFEDSFDTIKGELGFLEKVHYVITVDADTILPRESASTLIGTMAHPLNHAEFDHHSSKVISGYTILQPRTEVKPTSVNKTLLTRVFAGDLGLDLYTRAVSDVYQDLFGEGIYVGKGIYDVKAFHRSLDGKVPDNALLSHDLFEGLLGRAGLVSDVIFFEDYPPNYASQINRLHRWVRGDWQLFPWLLPKVPTRNGKYQSNPFSIIDLWKILDNLRRSLLSPAIFLSLLAGWFFLDYGVLIWTGIILLISAFPLINNVVTSLSSRFIMGSTSNLLKNIRTSFYRWFFWLIFLAYETLTMFDAITTTLIRVYISRKRLLQWQTAAHTIRLFGKQRKVTTIWQRMIGAPMLSLAVLLMILLWNTDILLMSLPFIVVWAISPQISYWISLERKMKQQEKLSKKNHQILRRIARRTWLYFEHFIGPEDHWLPPDHYQEDPKGAVAHRTSPTNIGLLMLSSVAAYDFGYIGVINLTYRMNFIFETLDEMEKYRGHLFNWYDTRSLELLTPRYISTVDSGNYAASLIGLSQSFQEIQKHPVIPESLWEGVYDAVDTMCCVLAEIHQPKIAKVTEPLHKHCEDILSHLDRKPVDDKAKIQLLDLIEDEITHSMNAHVKTILVSDVMIDEHLIREIRMWYDAIFQQVLNIKQQIKLLTPWIVTWTNRPDFFNKLENQVDINLFKPFQENNTLSKSLSELPLFCTQIIVAIKKLLSNEATEEKIFSEAKEHVQFHQWLEDLMTGLQQSKENASELLDQIDHLIQKAEFSLERMEFDFLFDSKREVFFLGYQLDSGRLDKNHYDLLASEARTASIFAISQNDVSRSHWLHMGRPLTAIDGIPTLISWNGSMFEYLMPNLYTNIYPETLLYQTSKGAVQAHINYGKKHNVPWGISESSYYRFDQADNYQYKGFGVPELGRKRGLANDLVIAPYACLLAVAVNPKAVLKNIQALQNIHAVGHFGFYESIDYTKSRLPIGQDKAIIKSYMAHHQGMIIVSLANYLNPMRIADRVHAEPRIHSTELLLQEQIPQVERTRVTKETNISLRGQDSELINIEPWTVDETQLKINALNVLSNGSLKLLMSSSGSGYLARKNIALTRWRKDAVLDPWGIWFYIQDLDEGSYWSIGQQPVANNKLHNYQVIFSPHMVEIRKIFNKMQAILQTTILPNEDVCVHKITLTNLSNEERLCRLLSYGEVVLAPQATDEQHPAFNKLFIESLFEEDTKMLLFTRRQRSSKEEPLGMAHLIYDEQNGQIEYECDRENFIGRGHNQTNPLALSDNNRLSKTTGITLDPIFSLGKKFSMGPNQQVSVTYMTFAAESEQSLRKMAHNLLRKAKTQNAFTSAESHHEKILRSLNIKREQIINYQQLLSRIIYPVSKMRPDSSILEKNVMGQSGLWAFGISGDYPILLVTIKEHGEIQRIQDLILAHNYWRKMQVMVDLVILNTKDTGYAQELNEKIHQAISLMESQSWVNQHGGIFVLTASQMNKDSIHLVKTAASVVYDTDSMEIDELLKSSTEIEPRLPQFVPPSAVKQFTSGQGLNRPNDWLLDNGLGGFTPDGREYQVFLENYPKSLKGIGQITPAPWVNVIANERFGFLVSESGSGYTWAFNSGENRLTPWSNDPVSDPPGESLYLRDEITGEIWSPTPQPAGENTDYLVRHGQGYTVFESNSQGFKQHLKMFTDATLPVKIVELTLRNTTDSRRRLTSTYFAEWVLGVHREKSDAHIVVDYDNQNQALTARNPYSAEFSECVAFLTSDQPIHGLTTDRAEFLGLPGDRKKPAGLQRVGLSGQVKTGLDPCAGLQIHLNFEPGEKKTIRFILGQGADTTEAKQLTEQFSKPEKIEQSWQQAKDKWDKILNTIQIKTPVPEMDILLNHWLVYQTLSSRVWGRTGFFQSSGAYGFRDQLQDVISVFIAQPEIGRQHILRAAEHQFEEGDVLHWWHPPSGRGVRTRITDDLLWLVYATTEYISQTGDLSILDQEVPFRIGELLDKDEEDRYNQFSLTDKKYPLFDHCRKALDWGDTSGPHKLPLIGSGDWNDGMNRVGIEGKGESVWLAWFLYDNLNRFALICDLVDEKSLADGYRKRAEQLKEDINQFAWDGDWFLRGYFDDGTPLGSRESEECQIDLLPQAWSVLTNGTNESRMRSAMSNVDEKLVQNENRLIRLFTPPFDKIKQDPGYIKGYPPGVRENGGQYTHAAIWAAWAFAELGLGDKAFQLFDYLNPITHSTSIENSNCYRVEPYAVAADVYSTEPFPGRGGWTWYTGSSSWLYRLGLEAILGLRLLGNSFTVNPCIPTSWEDFQVTFTRNECVYKISVKNPEHLEKGVKSVSLNGKTLENKTIPLQSEKGTYQVDIVMG